MSETGIRGAIAVAALLLVALGCLVSTGCGPTEGAAGAGAPREEPAAPEPEPVTVVTESQVFLDLSRTMSGFISEGRDGRAVTLQQDLLRNLLLEALGSVDMPEPTLWGFGRDVFPLPHPLAVYATGDSAEGLDGLYGENETDVRGALRRASKNPAALSLIVTDNAQDLRTAKEGTAPGFDRSAMRRTISEELVDEGFGVWLIGFRSGFVGEYFSILLSAGDRGVRVNRPIHLSSEQPMYVWVVCKCVARGRRVVDQLVRDLSARHAIRGGEGGAPVHAVELSPGEPPILVPDLRQQKIDRGGKEGRPPIDPERDLMRIRRWQRDAADPTTAEATLQYQRPRGGQLYFPLEARVEESSADRSWEGWPPTYWRSDWRVGEEGLRGAVTEEMAPFRCGEPEKVLCRRLSIAANQVAGVPKEQRKVQVQVALAFDPERIPRESWLRAWSTEDDTTREGVEGRTLYLSEVTLSVLEHSLGAERPAARFELELVRD